MRLVELDPQFLARKPSEVAGHPYLLAHVDTLAEADGLSFLCPKCFLKNDGAEGTHRIHVSFIGRKFGPSGWRVSGTTYSNLSLTPSIALPGGPEGCGYHGFVTNGEVTSV